MIKNALQNEIRLLIKDRFELDIPIFIISQELLKDIVNHAPDWWGNDGKEIYDNHIFLMPPLSYEISATKSAVLKRGIEIISL